MNAILCLLFGHRYEKGMACVGFYDGIENKYYTRYDYYSKCIKCGIKIETAYRVRQGAEQ